MSRSLSTYWWCRKNYYVGANTVTQNMSNSDAADDAHLADVPDGAGCTEIWERLSEGRDEEPDEE